MGSTKTVPRTRGDQPTHIRARLRATTRSPHTRGSTAVPPSDRCRRSPFPAHAGINRPGSDTPTAGTPVPRTRGDQPKYGNRLKLRKGRSPHTRGSTVTMDQFREYWPPFPAHAGINRRRVVSCGSTTTVPRTRGDQPSYAIVTTRYDDRSPHTRGSTDRLYRSCSSVGPFPAHAGINRCRHTNRPQIRPVPRTRGDQPPVVCGGAFVAPRSPHTRGSTGSRHDYACRFCPFPAHAGINRRSTT